MHWKSTGNMLVLLHNNSFLQRFASIKKEGSLPIPLFQLIHISFIYIAYFFMTWTTLVVSSITMLMMKCPDGRSAISISSLSVRLSIEVIG